MSELGCDIGQNVIACQKESGTGCPRTDGGPHYFIWDSRASDERVCMDCGTGEKESLHGTP